MSASVSSNPLPTHAGAERLAGFWTGLLALAAAAGVAWRRFSTQRGPAEMDARMRRDVGLRPDMVRAALVRTPWQIEAGLR
jgi:hypothetical protein